MLQRDEVAARGCNYNEVPAGFHAIALPRRILGRRVVGITVRLATQAFGKEKAGIAFGWIFAAHQLGAATAAFAAGLSRTEWNTYVPAFFGAGLACLIAAAAVWFIGARKPAAAAATA